MNRIILILLALAVTLPVIIKSRRSAGNAAPAAFYVSSSARSVVRISGEVRHPGIYRVDDNILTMDAISLAIPLWQPLRYVPQGAERLPVVNGADLRLTRNPDNSALIYVGMIPASQRLLLQIPLDLNTLQAADLERIPGIGPVLAQRIIARRHNNDGKLAVEDLLSIDGIGEKTYNRIRRYLK